MANIPIGNNIIYTKKKNSSSTSPDCGVETALFGAERVDTGISTDRKEIARDAVHGYNYERNAVDSKTIYNLRNQTRSCCFILDLETGRGGTSWYPGCKRIADISGTDVAMKSEASDTSQTIVVLQNGDTVDVLDVVYDASKSIWYSIRYNSMDGFVRNVNISNIRFVDNV